MIKVLSAEINIEDQNVVIRAKELLKVRVGDLSDFVVYYTIDDTSDDTNSGRNFVINTVEVHESFPEDCKVLGIIFDHVIIYC